MKHVLIAAAVSALLSACGGSSPETATTPTLPPTSDEKAAAPAPEPEPATPTEEARVSPEAVIDRAVAMFIAAATVVNAAAGDCTKMATDLNAWLDANDTERNLIMDDLAKIPEEERVEDFNAKMMQHREVLEAMQQSVGACMGTPEFDAAWERLGP